MNQLKMLPTETVVEYLQRLIVSLDTSGGYTIKKAEVNMYDVLHKGTVIIEFEMSESLVGIEEAPDGQ